MFEKIELFQVYSKAPPTVLRIEVPEATEKSEENENQENNSEVFVQHFKTKKNVIKSKHQGLVTAG